MVLHIVPSSCIFISLFNQKTKSSPLPLSDLYCYLFSYPDSSYCFKHWGHCLINLSFVYWANSKLCLESYRLKEVATGSHTGLRLGSYNNDEMFWHSLVPQKTLVSLCHFLCHQNWYCRWSEICMFYYRLHSWQ